ncbi:hypothetical protein OG339_48435 (plasmid) [Streptosporangium sp. NBC_01495]|uniref:hypothetical protein n=1 Tax=Streptosporangium sp. NBC_01495 TaxID=2903899 RepID=UPI002E37AD63|nr:hypothetical protein [Streptosporangium sp. NBC_01495]
MTLEEKPIWFNAVIEVHPGQTVGGGQVRDISLHINEGGSGERCELAESARQSQCGDAWTVQFFALDGTRLSAIHGGRSTTPASAIRERLQKVHDVPARQIGEHVNHSPRRALMNPLPSCAAPQNFNLDDFDEALAAAGFLMSAIVSKKMVAMGPVEHGRVLMTWYGIPRSVTVWLNEQDLRWMLTVKHRTDDVPMIWGHVIQIAFQAEGNAG